MPTNADGRKAIDTAIANSTDHGVTWVHSSSTPRAPGRTLYARHRPKRSAGRRPQRPARRAHPQFDVLERYSTVT